MLKSVKTEMEQKLATAESAVATHESTIAGLEAEKSEVTAALEAKQQEMSNAAAESEKMQTEWTDPVCPLSVSTQRASDEVKPPASNSLVERPAARHSPPEKPAALSSGAR